MPWHSINGVGIMRPINAATKKSYRGVNVISLWIAAQNNGYTTNKFATYKHWQEMGAQVRTGERRQFVVFWKITD